MTNIFARIQRPSLRWGLIFGIILGVVYVGYNFAASFINDADVQSILGYIPTLLLIIVGFYVGLRASQETGKWTSGVAAAIWVGVIAAVIFYLIPLINTLVNLQTIVASLKTHPISGMKPTNYSASDVIIIQLEAWFSYILYFTLFTLVSGALGSFVGRRRALAVVASQEHEELVPEVSVETEEIRAAEPTDKAKK